MIWSEKIALFQNKNLVKKENNNADTGAEENINSKTGIYNNNAEREKTGLYSSNENKKTGNSQGVHAGEVIRLKQVDYTVERVISEGTGEANVFLITDSSGNKYALKLYYEFNDEAEEPNSLALERIKNINDPDILRLIDYGTGDEKYGGNYCYEISEFAEGGNILEVEDFKKKYTPGFIEGEIIPQLFLAITRLHEYKIYHCDLKPGNILYKDKEQTDIVLGDYGSAKAYDLKSEKELRKSTTIKGTEFYLPPEQARGIVSEKNDYYSFGMVLLHLVYPEALTSDKFYREIDKDKFEEIVERQYNLVPIITFDPSLKRLNSIIEGLTLVNHQNRWGATEVEKWLKGEDVHVSYRMKESSDTKPLEIGPVVISTAEEFIRYIESKSSWFQDFFEDPEVYKLVKDWLDDYIGIPERKRFEKLVSIYRLSGKTILQAAVTMFLLPQRPLKIENTSYSFSDTDNVAGVVKNYMGKIDSVYRFTGHDMLSKYFFQLEYSLKVLHYLNPENKTIPALLNKLYNPASSVIHIADEFDFRTFLPAQIFPNKAQPNYQYMIQLFYSFNNERAYPDNADKPIRSAEELTIFYLKNKDLFRDRYHTFERNTLLKVFNMAGLVNTELPDLVGGVLSKYAESEIHPEYIAFEKVCHVHYSIVSTLDAYLKQKGIQEKFPFRVKEGFIYTAKNMMFANPAAQSFLSFVKEEHKDINFSEESLEAAKKLFIARHKKNFMLNNSIFIAAFVLSLAMVLLILLQNIK